MAKRLRIDITKPIETRCGYPIRIYEVFYTRYINGSFYDKDTDVWWPRQWDWNGFDEQHERNLDLINVTS